MKITEIEKGGFTYLTPNGNGLNNGNMEHIQRRLAHYLTAEDVYVDLGAHIGTMSIPIVAEKKPRKAIFVEAHPEVVPLLEANCRKNLEGIDWQVIHAAIYDLNEPVGFAVLDEKSDSSSMARADVMQGHDRVQVPGMTVDALLTQIDGPVVMKVDIECAEPLMWRGITTSAQKIRLMCMEWFQNAYTSEQMTELFEHFERAGYRYTDLDGLPTTEEKLRCCGKEDIFLFKV